MTLHLWIKKCILTTSVTLTAMRDLGYKILLQFGVILSAINMQDPGCAAVVDCCVVSLFQLWRNGVGLPW